MPAYLEALWDALRYGEPHGEFFGRWPPFWLHGDSSLQDRSDLGTVFRQKFRVQFYRSVFL
jgi:hypothetical protein